MAESISRRGLNLAGSGGLVMEMASGSRVNYVANRIEVRDNKTFINKFDKQVFDGSITRAKKTVVVGQDPKAGEFVPAGTRINLIMVDKDDIPTGSIDLGTHVQAKFPDVGKFLDDIEKKDDPVAEAAKDVWERDKEYKDLSSTEKKAVDAYMKDRLGDAATGTEEQTMAVYTDLKFLYML